MVRSLLSETHLRGSTAGFGFGFMGLGLGQIYARRKLNVHRRVQGSRFRTPDRNPEPTTSEA